PSVYGGGGSPSSANFAEESDLMSRESEALTSATKDVDGSGLRCSSTRGVTRAGVRAEPDGVTGPFARLESDAAMKTRDEKGGGFDEKKLEVEASEQGEWGGGAV
ncbi:hypothetical protein BP00DRAFT_319532, partial [Aspergillus indologenus CBS 114.80]